MKFPDERIADAGASELRHRMVDRLVAERTVTEDSVEAALRDIPRQLFAPEGGGAWAYLDTRIDLGRRSCLSPPSVVTRALEQLEVLPGHRVLEIGAGSGYLAALLGHLVGPGGSVVALEIDQELAHAASSSLRRCSITNVTVVAADGDQGWPSAGPYDRVLLSCASDRVSATLAGQLRADGRLQLPLVLGGTVQKSISFEFTDAPSRLRSVSLADCFFVPQSGMNDVWARSRLEILGCAKIYLAGDALTTRDAEAVSLCLLGEKHDALTDIVVSRREVYGGLAAWLATLDERCVSAVDMSSIGGWGLIPNLSRTQFPSSIGFYHDGELALLGVRSEKGPRQPTALSVRAFDGSRKIGDDLQKAVEGWIRAGRPGNNELRVDVTPAGESLSGRAGGPGRTVVRGSCRIGFVWEPVRMQIDADSPPTISEHLTASPASTVSTSCALRRQPRAWR